MAKNIMIAVLVSLLLIFAFLQNWYISSSYDKLTVTTKQIQEAINNKDVQKANESIDAFGLIWDENSDIWMSLMLHDQVDCVSKCYLLMKTFAQNGDLAQASVYLSQVDYALSDVYKIDQFSFRNIL
jgi:hypothetical protein